MSAAGAPPRLSPPRLLWTEPAPAAFTPLAQHRQRHGTPAWRAPVVRSGRLSRLLEAVDLRGRGGAGFPVARKLDAVASQPSTPIVLVNGVEGEPLSAKDRALLTGAPHLVLDGALALAVASGADMVVVAAQERTLPHLERALAERRDPVPIRVAATPRAFVAGEATALVNWLTAGDARPTLRPPRTFEMGLDLRPTLVQNVETVAQVALLAARGEEWFRGAGTAAEPGTTLVTLSGAVGRPGVYEVELGSPVADVVERAGGATEPLRALLAGGYFGAYLPAAALDGLRWGRAGLAEAGASPGAGVVHLLATSVCPAAEVARLATILAGESAGQCGPCRHGLAAIAAALRDLAAGGRGAGGDLARVRGWMAEVLGRGACRFPDGTVGMVRSALDLFADDWDAHARLRCVAEGGSAALAWSKG